MRAKKVIGMLFGCRGMERMNAQHLWPEKLLGPIWPRNQLTPRGTLSKLHLDGYRVEDFVKISEIFKKRLYAALITDR